MNLTNEAKHALAIAEAIIQKRKFTALYCLLDLQVIAPDNQ